jgi:hypothetical protein
MGMLAMVYRALQPAGYTISAVDELEWWEVEFHDPTVAQDRLEEVDLDDLDFDFVLGGEEIRTALILG